jgi:hypothetical protein
MLWRRHTTTVLDTRRADDEGTPLAELNPNGGPIQRIR